MKGGIGRDGVDVNERRRKRRTEGIVKF